MKKIGVEKLICFILIAIILLEGIYIFCFNRGKRSKSNYCSQAYACKCGVNNELDVCDCQYCIEWQDNKCIEEEQIQCDNFNMEDNDE